MGSAVLAELHGLPSHLCLASWGHPTRDWVCAAGRQGAVTWRGSISLPSAHCSIPPGRAGARSWQEPGASSSQDLQLGFSTGPQCQQLQLLVARAGGCMLWFLLPEQPLAFQPPPPANGNREPWAHTSRVTLWGSGHGGAALSHPLPSGAPQTGPEWGRLHSWPQHSSTVPWLHSRHNAGAPLAITPMWGARGMCVWGARPGSARHSQSLRVPTAAVSGCQRWRSQRPNKQGLSATRQPACRRAWPDAAFPFVRS